MSARILRVAAILIAMAGSTGISHAQATHLPTQPAPPPQNAPPATPQPSPGPPPATALVSPTPPGISPPPSEQASPAAPPPPGSQPLMKETLSEGMPVNVTLDTYMKSGGTKVGTRVAYHTTSDIDGSDHALLIPAGSPAYGRVTQSRRHGYLGQPGKLAFTCEYVVAPDGTRVPLRHSHESQHGRNNTAAMAAATVLVSPLALLIEGNDVAVHPGERFTLYVDRDSPLMPVQVMGGEHTAPAR